MKNLLCLLTILLPILANGQSMPSDKLITVIGTSYQEIEPDWVVIQMSAKETDNTTKGSDIVHMENEIITFITGLGMETSSFSIDKFSANTKYTYSSSSKFKVQKSYELKITDTRLLDTIIAKCFDAGMDNLYVGEIGHSKIDSVQNSVLLLALENAKNKAELIAESMGIEQLKIASVNETYKVVNYGPDRYVYDDFRLEEMTVIGYGTGNKTRVGSSLSLQKIEVNKTVIVTYEIQ
jgi:uncharacterized protein YggE